MKSSTYYFHMKAKILADFQIYISVPLREIFLRQFSRLLCTEIYKTLNQLNQGFISNTRFFIKNQALLGLYCLKVILHQTGCKRNVATTQLFSALAHAMHMMPKSFVYWHFSQMLIPLKSRNPFNFFAPNKCHFLFKPIIFVYSCKQSESLLAYSQSTTKLKGAPMQISKSGNTFVFI